jgi:HK97 family phage prohead protease
MTGILALQKRMAADAGRIYWQPKDFERLARHYKVDADQVAKLATPTPPTFEASGLVTKSATAAADVQTSFKWTMNDGLRDRAGDVVMASGVSLDSFKSNPIALFQHSPNHPIGTWSGVHAEHGRLKGTLNLATAAIPLAESVRKMISAGVVRAASIGFVPLEWEFDVKGGPGANMLFHKIELMECSCVSIPSSRGSLREREVTPAERKAEVEALVKRIRADDAAYASRAEAERTTKRETPRSATVIALDARLAQAKARRAELELIAGMNPRQHADYLNAKAERKEELRLRLKELRGQS